MVLIEAINKDGIKLQEGDIIVIAQTLVSKSEGRVVYTRDVNVSQKAYEIAKENGFDPIHVELALRECVDIVRDKGVLITETHQGLVCNFSGVDRSNAPDNAYVLLPRNPDESARQIQRGLQAYFGCSLAVIISDTQGRPWRRGSVNVAIGCSGINAFKRYKGEQDIYGYTLRKSTICHVDEIAAAVEPLMGQADELIPAVIMRGYSLNAGLETASAISRSKEESQFR